jgi:hypothetical protein
VLSGLQFPFRFDAARLQADLARVLPYEWAKHYNDQDYGGDWRGVALRSVNGTAGQLFAEHAESTFLDTPLLGRCPYFREALSVFECPLKSVRLLSLAPQSYIREHSDHALDYEDGEVRIHIPIQTNPDVEFYVSGERLLLEEGHSYYVNVNLPHRVNNRGTADRVHLVIDAKVNEWVHALFRRGQAEAWHIPRSPLPPRNLDEFRRLVLETPAMVETLWSVPDQHRFTETALEIAREKGFDLHEGDLHAGFRRPLGCESAPAPTALAGWTPTRVFFRDGRPCAEWVFRGSGRFTEPSYEDSIRAFARRPFTAFFRRELPIPTYDEIACPGRSLAPAGFIFHMSRCGSTLISQMLAALPRIVMISEAPPIDDILQARFSMPDLALEEQACWLRSVVAALGQRPTGAETRYFVKLDAWHIHNLPLIREAFPATPWTFVYRDPLEVLASTVRVPGRQFVPGMMDPRILKMQFDPNVMPAREAWNAQVLAGFLRSALSYRFDPGALFVNYRQLPDAVFGPIARHFGITLQDDEITLMRQTALVDAKQPYRPFQADSHDKQSRATPLLRELSATLLDPLYQELEAR